MEVHQICLLSARVELVLVDGGLVMAAVVLELVQMVMGHETERVLRDASLGTPTWVEEVEIADVKLADWPCSWGAFFEVANQWWPAAVDNGIGVGQSFEEEFVLERDLKIRPWVPEEECRPIT